MLSNASDGHHAAQSHWELPAGSIADLIFLPKRRLKGITVLLPRGSTALMERLQDSLLAAKLFQKLVQKALQP